jgi:transposase
MKYTKEFKLECVMKHKNGIHIEDPPGVKHKGFHEQVRRWSHIYDSLGEAGLSHIQHRMSIEEKLKLLIRVENGESYSSVAHSVGIENTILIRWHKVYRQEGIEGLQSLKRGRPKMSRKPKVQKPLDQMTPEEKVKYYEERLEYLEAENAYLKKLKALVEQRQDRQRKKE